MAISNAATDARSLDCKGSSGLRCRIEPRLPDKRCT